jgi:hypothetical protein
MASILQESVTLLFKLFSAWVDRCYVASRLLLCNSNLHTKLVPVFLWDSLSNEPRSALALPDSEPPASDAAAGGFTSLRSTAAARVSAYHGDYDHRHGGPAASGYGAASGGAGAAPEELLAADIHAGAAAAAGPSPAGHQAVGGRGHSAGPSPSGAPHLHRQLGRPSWINLDDAVMGGTSSSSIRWAAEVRRSKAGTI